jgi:hypothetical protein
MANMRKETLERVIGKVYGLEIPKERLNDILRIVNHNLEALEKSFTEEMGGLEPSSIFNPREA